MTRQKWTAFVGGPFSAALTIENGDVTQFDVATRSALDRVHAMFSLNGFGLLSSHLAEDYGREIHEETLVQRDNAWLKASDVYVATLPWSQDEPVRSDGTFVEIGLALGLGVPCVLIIERGDDPQWSYYVRNLHSEPAVLVLPIDMEDDAIVAAVTAHIEKRLAIGGARNRSLADIDAHVLFALTSGGKAGHTVHQEPHVLQAPPFALTSRYCSSVTKMVEMASQRSPGHVWEMGCGIGEASLAFLRNGSSVQAYEPNPKLEDACWINMENAGFAENLRWFSDVEGTDPTPDLLAVHLPPLAVGKDPFLKRREAIHSRLTEILPDLTTGTDVWIGTGTPAEIDAERAWIEKLPLDLIDNTEEQSVGLFRAIKA